MKNYLIIAAFLACGALFSACTGAFVAERPGEVTYNRPVAPGEGYVWIDGDWVWGSGRYTWNEGRWDRPRSGHIWHPGGWNHTARGYRWNRGRW
ncbi:MAG TPA: hypothetical protein VKI61_16615 [Chitinophagaceae bacterium]|jgi:WXXGXW repeat (2 copies)|nr:hypothetical protein [Chitinophagaceae bacterium]